MIRSLSTAATGMEAQSANIERISNDLANVNTDAYKRGRTEFKDLMYETITAAGGAQGSSSQTPVGIQRGTGVRVGAQYKIFEQGPARMTNHPYDLMIEGRGFFPVQLPNGEVAYTRNGSFHLDNQGRVTTSSGALLLPQIQVPAGASGVTITQNGEVRVSIPQQGEVVVGQIQLATFQNEQGLGAIGDSLFAASQGSGPPIQGIPGENGIGSLMQGSIEGSNVNVPQSMVDMITTQRAFELNSKVLTTADQMWSSLNSVRQ